MRYLLLISCYILCVTFANAQVRPDNFIPRTEIDSSNTEFYSQKDGVSRRINVFDVRRYTLLDVIDGYQATPTDTGNTDIGRLVKDTLGQKYIIDGDGDSELVYDSLQWQSLSFSNDTIYISGVSTGIYLGALAGAGTDDQTLAEVLTEGNTATNPINMNNNDITAINETFFFDLTAPSANPSITAINGDFYFERDGDTLLAIPNTGGLGVYGNYTLPGTDGTSNQVLQTNGAGVVSWATVSGGTSEWTDGGTYLYPSETTDNVVIGSSTTPGYRLEITENSAGGNGIFLNNDNSSGLMGLYFSESGVGSLTPSSRIQKWGSTDSSPDLLEIINESAAGELIFGTNNTNRLTIQSDGDIEINKALTNDNALNHIMARDSVTGEVKYVQAWTLGSTPALSEVLTQGATANTAIDMNGNNLNNVGNLTVDATTNDFVIDGNGTNLEVTVAATERFSISQTGVVQINNAFSFPTADGTSGQVLKTDGAGSLTWQSDNDSGAGSGSQEYDFAAADTSTTALTSSTWNTVTWDTEIIEDASFTHTAGSADILFDSIGTYIITATLITNYASRNDAWVGINIDTGSGYPATPVLISQLPIHFSTPAGFNQMGMTLTYIHVATDTNDKARCSIYPSAASFSYGKSQLRIQRID